MKTNFNRYEVVKFYQDNKHPRVITIGLTELEAQRICKDPETSSMTAKKPRGCGGDPKKIDKWNNELKHWFYGYRSY